MTPGRSTDYFRTSFNVAGDPSLLDTATPADDFGFRLSTGVALASQALSLRLAAYHNIGGIGDRDSGITAVLSLSLN